MELHAEPKLAAQERMVDDASGEVQVHKKTQTHTVHAALLDRFGNVC